MPPLRRHQLAHLNTPGWRRLLACDRDAASRACLQHWAAHALPLVVTRQRQPRPTAREPLALGLAAPTRWGRRALALQVAPEDIAWFSEFPVLAEALPEFPRGDRPALQTLAGSLQREGVRPHAYGSAGWQHLSGLAYLHAHSDLDLWLAVDGATQADAAVHALATWRGPMRLDGELMFPDGSAVAWREWAAWRAGRCDRVLVKRLHGVSLEAQPEALAAPWPCVA